LAAGSIDSTRSQTKWIPCRSSAERDRLPSAIVPIPTTSHGFRSPIEKLSLASMTTTSLREPRELEPSGELYQRALAELARAQGVVLGNVGVYVDASDAYARDETELANVYFKRFRAEFKPAVHAWIATRPLRNPDAPLTPLAMPQYRLPADRDAKQLDAKAELSAATVRLDIQWASNLRTRRRPLRRLALLLGHEHQARCGSPEAGHGRPRLRRVRCHRGLNSRLPGERRWLVLDGYQRADPRFTALSLVFLLKDGPSIKTWGERHLGVALSVAHTSPVA
jgi:hypothetical protein